MTKLHEDGRCAWSGWTPEPEVTGDGSGDPDKHFITVWVDGSEVCVIVHRTCGGKFPLDGVVARWKQHNAEVIVGALNAAHDGSAAADLLFQLPASSEVT